MCHRPQSVTRPGRGGMEGTHSVLTQTTSSVLSLFFAGKQIHFLLPGQEKVTTLHQDVSVRAAALEKLHLSELQQHSISDVTEHV